MHAFIHPLLETVERALAKKEMAVLAATCINDPSRK